MAPSAKDPVAKDAAGPENREHGDAQPTAPDAPADAMARYQAGSYAAFEEVYAYLAPRLRGYFANRPLLFGATVEDLVQETFLQMHRARRSYRPDLPVEPWAFAIARHVYLMDCRRRTRRVAPEVGEEALAGLAGADEREAVLARLELERALGKLGSGRRLALLLHDLVGWSFGEIGALLDTSSGAAKVRASRGRADVRRALGDGEDGDGD